MRLDGKMFLDIVLPYHSDASQFMKLNSLTSNSHSVYYSESSFIFFEGCIHICVCFDKMDEDHVEAFISV